jgi:hypothetical protein
LIKAFRSNLYTNSICSVSFAHLKSKSLLEQWKNLESHYLIMTRITKNVFNASSFDVSNERLFFIANRIYESHKSYHSATIRAKMIIRQHDDKENEWELKNMLSDLKKKEKMFISKIREEKDIRDQILRDETKDYINDVDEILSFIVSISKITTRCVCLRCLINVITDSKKNEFIRSENLHSWRWTCEAELVIANNIWYIIK